MASTVPHHRIRLHRRHRNHRDHIFDTAAARQIISRHRAFWAQFEDRHPAERSRRVRHGPWFWQRGLPELNLVITMYVAPEQHIVGVFFGRNERLGAVDTKGRTGNGYTLFLELP